MVRLYPVPFRLLQNTQFKKWQWITALVEKTQEDKRIESHRIKVDTISIDGRPISTARRWMARRPFINRIPAFEDFAALEKARVEDGTTIGLLRPSRILSLEITGAKTPDWTRAERNKLVQLQNQGDLFGTTDKRRTFTLRKLPFDFHYTYVCESTQSTLKLRHKLVDWEIGALYWNVFTQHGDKWEAVLREKVENDLPKRDLMFLMGNIHRFPNQWLIISLIYPPKQLADQPLQHQLL